MQVIYRYIALILLLQAVLLFGLLGAVFVQAERLNALNATLDAWEENIPLSSSSAVPGFGFSNTTGVDSNAISPVLVRQIVREEVAVLTNSVGRLESAISNSAPTWRQDDVQSVSVARTRPPEELQPIRDAVARGLRELSRNSDPFGPQHTLLVSNIMQLPAEERGEAMRQLNQRMNQ